VPAIALLAPYRSADKVFSERHYTRLQRIGTLVDARFAIKPDEVMPRLAEVEAIVSTWGMPRVDTVFLERAPGLRAVFYAAGSVKRFVSPALWSRGIIVSSSAPANAIAVAEYTLAVILLSNKRFWSVMRSARKVLPVPGNYRRQVGIIGASRVGRELIRLLKGTDLEVRLYDPFVTGAEAAQLGVHQADLPELMAASDVVTLHAPNLPSLRHMINAELLARMKDGATFINTARGALVDEAALIAELTSGRIFAVLDVTEPEPPAAASPFYTLPNVIITPHIAGSMDQECHRMADFAIDELERFLTGKPLLNPITSETIAHMA
jgi:phosphoglycerate dehydrogenase-like enzyme